MQKKLFLGANWKMNPPPQDSLRDGSPYFSDGDPEIVVFPTFIDLQNCIRSGHLIVGAQCGRAGEHGAFTGDVSIKMLQEFGCSYVLCGHSDRRRYHHETEEEVGKQFMSALDVGLIPVLCVGETAEERAAGKTKEVLQRQLSFLNNAHSSQLTAHSFLVAYEPVWAIGTGKTPIPEEAEKTHQFIRSLLPNNDIRILYGGSVTAANAHGFFAQPNIDGGLIGGASLKPQEFAGIVEAAKKLKMEH